MLGAVQNAKAFRDSAGLAGTQGLAQAGLQTAAALATSFGSQATALKVAEIASKQQATADADKKIASIRKAKDKEVTSAQEAEKRPGQRCKRLVEIESQVSAHGRDHSGCHSIRAGHAW